MSKKIAVAKSSTHLPQITEAQPVMSGKVKITQEHIQVVLGAIQELSEGKTLTPPERWLLLRMSLDVFHRKNLADFDIIFFNLKRIFFAFNEKAESRKAKKGGK